jgi:hypothetical protein
MLFSIAWLFRDYETHGRAVASARRLLGLTVLIIGFFLLLAVSDYDFDHATPGNATPDLLLVGIPLFVPMLAGIVVAAFRSSKRYQPGGELVSENHPVEIGWVHRTMWLAFLILLAGTGIECYLNYGATAAAIPHWMWAVYGFAVGILLGALVAQTPSPKNEIQRSRYEELAPQADPVAAPPGESSPPTPKPSKLPSRTAVKAHVKPIEPPDSAPSNLPKPHIR